MTANKEKYTDINLTKTDYDNFKNLKFFIEQHKKALQMIQETENFYDSFIKSKLLTIKQLAKKDFPLISVYQNKDKTCWAWNIKRMVEELFFDKYERESFKKLEKLESKVTREFNIQIKKGIEIKEIEKSLNDKFTGNMYGILLDGMRWVNKFMVCLTNDIKLLHIPHDSKSKFLISDDEKVLKITFTNINKYKKYQTPGWLPYTVDTTTIVILFDTTTNNYLSHKRTMRTHEEQDSANRGY